MTRVSMSLLVLAAFAGGCIGTIGDGKGGDGKDGDPPHAVDPDKLGVDDTRRLSPSEYVDTLRILVGDPPVDAALSALAGLPNDRGKNEFASMERGITAAHVDSYYAVAKAVADYASTDMTTRALIHSCLADAAPDQACVAEAMESFGLRAFRRPLSDDERLDILASFDDGAAQLSFDDGLALALMAVFQMPAFLYHLELGDGGEAAQQFELTSYELASRLSYFLTGGPPDAALLALAKSDALKDEANYGAEVARLIGSPRAAQHIARFFTEWLGLDRIPVPQHSPASLGNVDPATAAQEMAAELQALIAYHVVEHGSDYATMMTSNLAVPGDNLAEIYGVPAGEATAISNGLRDGLLTRAAFLVGSEEMTHPIQRGAFVMRTLLCDDIAPPPPSSNIEIEPPPVDPSKTARERWTAQTSEPNCAGCHERINGFGFALERYDALGRYRTEENGLPIDDTVDLLIDGETITVTGGTGLSAALGVNPRAQACLARKWFRFGNGRRETSFEVEAMIASVQTPGTAIAAVLEQIAHSPGFRLRNMEGDDQ